MTTDDCGTTSDNTIRVRKNFRKGCCTVPAQDAAQPVPVTEQVSMTERDWDELRRKVELAAAYAKLNRDVADGERRIAENEAALRLRGVRRAT